MLMKLLLFNLPIIRRQETGQIVRAIRQVFTFLELLESYFAEKAESVITPRRVCAKAKRKI
ncbi:25149_t:CDS:2 [Gigaspora rosea]|nr:25149_t:CDS:2 [Gigaspora rosea]